MYATVHIKAEVAGYSFTMQIASRSNLVTTADEVERLKCAEAEAEARHEEAMRRGDPSAVRIAADAWVKASNALTEYVAAHPDLYRDG